MEWLEPKRLFRARGKDDCSVIESVLGLRYRIDSRGRLRQRSDLQEAVIAPQVSPKQAINVRATDPQKP